MVEWGTVGEWVSGLAVIVAVLALRLEIQERREEKQRLRKEEETRVARHIFVWSGRRMKDNAGEWFQEVLFSNTSGETVRSLTVCVEFPRHGSQVEPLEERFSGPLRPTFHDSVNVSIPRAWADRIGGVARASPRYAEGASGLSKRFMDDEAERWADQKHVESTDDWMTTALGDAVVSARFEDHQGRRWRKRESGELERLDS